MKIVRFQNTKLGNVIIVLCLLSLNTTSVQIAEAARNNTVHDSVVSNGVQGNGSSLGGTLSLDGRYVVFNSAASNLVSGDTNGAWDVFVYDQQTGKTIRVSVASDGTQGDSESDFGGFISADGRYVAYTSLADNLVSGDTNGVYDAFVHDLQTGITTRISVASDGTQGNLSSYSRGISADGRYVVFDSYASNLVSGDTNSTSMLDVFVHDRQTGQTTRVSIASDGTQGSPDGGSSSSISADGRYVTFDSLANNLVSGDTNGVGDIFVHDRQTGQTTRVSIASSGAQANDWSYYPYISADGRYVTFRSAANNLVSGDTNNQDDIFVHDRLTGQTTRVSVASDGTQGNEYSDGASISDDGRFVTFFSLASTLVNGDTNGSGDVFIYDRQTGETIRISVDSNSAQGNDWSYSGSISGNGRYVVFSSKATNLVSGDTNGENDVFVRDLQTGITQRVSVGNDTSIPSWTIMVYLDGDTDSVMDSEYFNVFNQFEYAANNSAVNVVAVWDRLDPNIATYYYKIQPNTDLTKLASYTEGVNRWYKGELNMGAPATLSDFIQWARSSYPAQHYALFISDHGTGLNGTAKDFSNGNQWINVNELGTALSTATSNGSNKLDIVFADSCLMAMIEVAYQIRNYANIFIASENQIWIPDGGSRPYSNYINGITATTTPRDLAINIVNEYGNFLNDLAKSQPTQAGYTLSAVDLTKIGPLITAISGLAGTIRPQLANIASQIENSRKSVQKFDSVANHVIDNSDEYVDLVDLAVRFRQDFTDPNIQNAAESVVDTAVPYVIGNRAKPGDNDHYPSPMLDGAKIHGVSIFFPPGTWRRSFYNGLNLDFAADTLWGTQAASASLSVEGVGWGPMLVDFIANINPSAPDNPIPPELVSPEPVGSLGMNNGPDTTGVFRPSNGVLFLKNTNTTGFADVGLNYGNPGDYPVVGDWDGNGTVTIGVYRNGSFYLRNSNTVGFAELVFPFGQPGDQPIAGDWDGDGTDTIGVYRPSNGQFLLHNSNSAGAADASFFLGNVGDVGIAGDWNGDGMDTTGVFRPSNGVIFLKNTNTTGFADIAINYGIPGDKPVTGDWDNDGIDTIGVYRNGQFMLRNSNTVGFADIVFGLGNPGDMPIAGNWDGLP